MPNQKSDQSTLLYVTDNAAQAGEIERGLKRAGFTVEDRTAAAWKAPYTLAIEVDADVLAALETEIESRQRFLAVWSGFVDAPASGAGWRVQFGAWLHQHASIGTGAQLAHAGACFDLRDPLTASFFMEFIAEFPERAEHWRAFERARGGCDCLDWRDKAKVLPVAVFG